MDGSPSLQIQALSLFGVQIYEASVSIASQQLPLSREAGAHCQTTAASHARGSVHWAPVSRAACTLGTKEHSWPAHLCATLRAREWE